MISGGSTAESQILMHEREQSSRVSLVLQHDAGYEAPVAWRLLSSQKPQPLSEIETPDRATYLYGVLGEVWHNPAANVKAAH
jgi:hypothetical protein